MLFMGISCDRSGNDNYVPQSSVPVISVTAPTNTTTVIGEAYSFTTSAFPVFGTGEFFATFEGATGSASFENLSITFSPLTETSTNVFQTVGTLSGPFTGSGTIDISIVYVENGLSGSVLFTVTVPMPPPPVLTLGTERVLSVLPDTPAFDGESASKGKILRLTYSDGAGGFVRPLISVYGDAAGPDVWDFSGAIFPAQDIFMTRSLDDGITWSQPINLSLTANLTSISVDDDGDPATATVPYYGHCEKPNIFGTGRNIVVTWVGYYVPSGVQSSVVYLDANSIEVPYAATYCVRSTDGGATWSTAERLSDGSRDAKQDNNNGNSNGFVLVWQEDPEGLQPGDAEGPGDGGSGAKVSRETDIWMTALSSTDLVAGVLFPAPIRVSNNQATGRGGASRPNLAVIGNAVIIAYEETKNLSNISAEIGKYILYHTISLGSSFNLSAASDPTAGAGWIISDADENARRVRILSQSTAGTTTGIRIVFFWRQGETDQGGPSDIMVRIGYQNALDASSTGFRPQDLFPTVSTGSTDRAVALLNPPPINLSSSAGLSSSSSADFLEDALAHRGLLRDDFLLIGYSYTADWALATYSSILNYNFFIRRSFDGGATWDEARNISNVTDTTRSVREPRVVGTASSPDPAEIQDTNTYIVAWGVVEHEYPQVTTGRVDLDIFLTRTTDQGNSYETPFSISGTGSELTREFESQFRVSPDGNTVYGVWMEEQTNGAIDVLFNTFTE